METISSIEKFSPERLLSPDEIRNILFELDGLKGIASFNIENDFISIEYYQQLMSPDLLKDALLRAGFPFRTENTKKGVFRKFILKLGEENKKEFGGRTPKCCG